MRYVYTGSETAAALVKHFEGVELCKGHLCDPVRRVAGEASVAVHPQDRVRFVGADA